MCVCCVCVCACVICTGEVITSTRRFMQDANCTGLVHTGTSSKKKV